MLSRISVFWVLRDACRRGIATTTSCRMPRGGRTAEEAHHERGLGRHEEDDEDRFGRKVDTTFGSIRFDSPPVEKEEPSAEKSKSTEHAYLDQYRRQATDGGKATRLEALDDLYKTKSSGELHPIDDEYFGSYFQKEAPSRSPRKYDSPKRKQESAPNLVHSPSSSTDLNPVDEEYFGSYFRGGNEASGEFAGLNLFGGAAEVIRFPTTPSPPKEATETSSNNERGKKAPKTTAALPQTEDLEVAGGKVHVRTIINEPVTRETDVFNVEDPQTAFDYAMKLRLKERSEKDVASGKFGFDWRKMTREEIYRFIRSSVIYNENDIVAFDKPYGISCQGGPPNDLSFLSKHLERLGAELGAQDGQLHYIHRIDKNCTGVVVYAKTPEMAALLRASFAQRKVVKIYWAVLKGTPDPPEGIIDIPIAEGRVGERRRMVLKPVFRPGSTGKQGSPARTYYKVLATRGSAALAELRPETGLKHQLRVHTSFGLSCGILGDHKYSFRDKFAPQCESILGEGGLFGKVAMAFVTAYDLRLAAPLSRSFRSGNIQVGFSQGCDLILPNVLSPDIAELIQDPIFMVERVCRGGFAVQAQPIVVPSAIVGARIRLAKIPCDDGIREDGGDYMALQSGDCVSVNIFKVNRLSPVFDARRNMWPICHLQVFEPEEPPPPSTKEDEEEPPVPSHLLDLLPEIQLRIMRFLDFETIAVVLPAVSQEVYALARRAVADPPDFFLKIGPNGSHLREFLSIYSRNDQVLNGVRFGETLGTLELRGAAMRAARVAVDVESFIRMLPNLKSLTVGKGVFKFVAAAAQVPLPPFTSRINQFRVHWSAMAAYPGAFPFSTLMPELKSIVIVSSSEGFYDSGVFHEIHLPEIAGLPLLVELTFAWCSLVPSSDWRRFFENLEGRRIEVLRIPGCAGVEDQVLQVISRTLPHLQLFEATKVRGVTDDGITGLVRRCRSLQALLVTHFYELKGTNWLQMAACRESSVEYVDATGSGCARSVPLEVKEANDEVKQLLKRGAFGDLMPA